MSLPTFDVCTCQRALAENPHVDMSGTAEALFDWWCSRSESSWPWASFVFRIFANHEFSELKLSERA